MERTCGKAVADGPIEAADCGAGRARLQLDGEAVVGDPGEAAAGGTGGPTFVCR